MLSIKTPPSGSPKPRTPSPSSRSKNPSARALIDSPFSDYWTDSSPVTFSPSVGNAQPLEDGEASPAQRRLLSRLSRIGAQMLQRTPSDDATRLLDVLESAVSAPIAT